MECLCVAKGKFGAMQGSDLDISCLILLYENAMTEMSFVREFTIFNGTFNSRVFTVYICLRFSCAGLSNLYKVTGFAGVLGVLSTASSTSETSETSGTSYFRVN